MLLAVLTVGAMSGCVECTTETEYGTVTHNLIVDQTVEHVDTYEDGMHITGKMVTTNGSTQCDLRYEIDEYRDGIHITGIATYKGDPDDMTTETMYYNIRYEMDEYQDGLHITGIGTYQGFGFNEDNIRLDCNVDGYIEGFPVTGTITIYGNDNPIYNLHYNVDTYKDGMHITGTMTLSGSDNSNWYMNCNVNGYAEGYPVTGTMIGYISCVYTTLTVHTPYGDFTETTIQK